jgi:uncharacterized membrane protein
MFEALLKYPRDLFAEGRLALAGPLPAEVLVLGAAGLAVLVWWLYRRGSPSATRRPSRVLVALRIAAIALLALLLAVPVLRIARPPQAVFTAVMVDVSRSMSLADAGSGESPASRFDAAVRLLGEGEGGGLIERLGRHSRVLLYGFDGGARRVASLDGLEARGQATDLFRSMRDVEAELRGLPLAAVVMVTDGCRNEGGSGEDAAALLKARRVPLFTVGLGNTTPPRDYEVVRVFAPRRVRRNTEVEVYATVRHTDFRGPFDVIVSRGDTQLAVARVDPGASSEDVRRVRIAFTPDIEGTATYRVRVPEVQGEALAGNNAREFVLEIQDDRLPVLYVEGSPRLEYRFLRRALYRDRDFRLVGMLRLARDRFYIQGANEAERYLERGFPDAKDAAARERLFAFEAVILGDIEAAYFTPQQQALLEEFVRVRGGGLLMLGGVNSFGLGGYAGTPVGKMLPLDLSPADPPYADDRYRAVATPEGLVHPLMRLAPDADENRLLWEKAPPLIGLTPIRRAKAGAAVLLAQEATNLPVLAVQDYGQGRVAGFTSGGSWYWQVSMPASDEFHEKFWKQLVRWLVVGARERLTVETDADVYAQGQPVTIKAAVRQKDLQPVSDAAVVAVVTDPLGNRDEIPMDWTLSEDGVYQCRYRPVEEGNYAVAVRVQGWDVPPAEGGFEVTEPYAEFSNAGLKADLLRRMAEATGGRYVGADEAAAVLPDAVAREVRAAGEVGIQPVDREVWDTPLVFGVLIGIMAVEWFLRRRSGLA